MEHATEILYVAGIPRRQDGNGGGIILIITIITVIVRTTNARKTGTSLEGMAHGRDGRGIPARQVFVRQGTWCALKERRNVRHVTDIPIANIGAIARWIANAPQPKRDGLTKSVIGHGPWWWQKTRRVVALPCGGGRWVQQSALLLLLLGYSSGRFGLLLLLRLLLQSSSQR